MDRLAYSLIEAKAPPVSKAKNFLCVAHRKLETGDLENLLSAAFPILADLIDQPSEIRPVREESRKLAELVLSKMQMLAMEIRSRRRH
jgi:hypothetical protein